MVRVGQCSVPSIDFMFAKNRISAFSRLDKSAWHVPVTICDASDSSKVLKRVIIPPSALTKAFKVKLPMGSKIRFNPGIVGFYRVHYEDSLMSPILEALGEKKLDHKDRLCLLSDTFALVRFLRLDNEISALLIHRFLISLQAKSGRVKMTSALSMVSTLRCEMDYIVWVELRSQLANLLQLLLERFASSGESGPSAESVEEALNAFIIHLAEPPFKRLGWNTLEKVSSNDALLRPLLIAALGSACSPDVIAEAKSRFDRHYKAVMASDKGDSAVASFQSNELIPADLRLSVYATCVKNFGEEVFDRLLQVLLVVKNHLVYLNVFCYLPQHIVGIFSSTRRQQCTMREFVF